MRTPSRTALLISLALPLLAAGAALAGPCPDGRPGDCAGGSAPPLVLAWRDVGSGPPPDPYYDRGNQYDPRAGNRYDPRYGNQYDSRGGNQYGPRGGYQSDPRGGYQYDSRGGYPQGNRNYQSQYPGGQQRQGPLPPQAYPGGVRPTCAAGTHLEGWDCVRDASGPAIIDQSREGCPPDYHTNRKGTKCIRNGYQE